MSSTKSPHDARRSAAFAPVGSVKQIAPATFSDGQSRDGTPQENVHRDQAPHYAHPKARAYREDLQTSPSVPTHHKPVPPEAGFNGNIHEHVRRGKR